MQIVLPPIPPVQVTFTTLEPYFWGQWDFWLSIGTFGLVLLTGLLALETRRMRLSSDRISRDMLQNAQRSLIISEENAKTATAAVAVASESMQRTLRAYVTLDPFELLRQDRLKIPEEINVCVINTGQTPASNVEVYYSFRELPSPPEEFDVDVEKYSTGMHAVVGNGQIRKAYAACKLSDLDKEDLQSGRAFLMVYGCAKYHDMFSREPRYTRFSFAWDCKLQMFYPYGPMNSLS